MRITKQVSALLTIVYVYIGSGYAQRNECGLERFQCRNGECIAGELLCDGKANCKDSSDETRAECMKPEILCPDYAFRCQYGACVNGDSVCNGIQDCLDNSDETLSQCTTSQNNNNRNENNNQIRCRSNQFPCDNGQCINSIDVCDGRKDCADGSDETFARCGSLTCPPTVFRCAYGACIDGDLRCNGVVNCADGSDEDPGLCGGNGWPSPLPTVRPTTSTTTRSPTPGSSVTPGGRRTCKAPPQPQNGYWKLHRSQCPNIERDCDISEGTDLGLGSYLIYSCNSGYKIKGSTDVSCSLSGWLNIPVCEEIRCKGLSSASISTECTYNNEWVSCDSPVLPGTAAKLSCRNSYQPESSLLSRLRDFVRCNANGQWEPEPIRCVPGPLAINIYLNNNSLVFHTTLDRKNVTFIEILDDRIIIHTNVRDLNYPNIDVRISPNNDLATEKSWTWS